MSAARVQHHAWVIETPYRSTLSDIVHRLAEFDRGDRYEVGPTIFAERPWGVDSPAVVACEETVHGALPSEPEYAYVLEVASADEVLSVWSAWRSGRLPNIDEATAAVIHYAEHDAYEPVE